MTEFLLALPVLAFILALLLFLGWSLMRQQHVVAAARYAVWREMESGVNTIDAPTVNTRLLGGAAQPVDMSGGSYPAEAIFLWQDTAAQEQVGPLALAFFDHNWPTGHQLRLDVHYQPPTNVGRQFGNDFAVRVARDGPPWIREQVQPWPVLTRQYYQDLDDQLSGVPLEAQPVAEVFRDLYRSDW